MPTFLFDLIVNTRLAGIGHIVVPSPRANLLEKKTFIYRAITHWNNLPLNNHVLKNKSYVEYEESKQMTD